MYLKNYESLWGVSSAGRAPALQAGGQRFDPANLHQIKEIDWSSKSRKAVEASLSLLQKKLKDAPWKLNIVNYWCNYEKATVKENF